ncbi:MAG: serpin family protein [Rhodothermales bacterium]
MTRTHPFLTLLLVLGLLASGCTLMEPDEDDPPAELRPLTSAEAQVSEADNRFGLKLFRALSEDERDENLFISPLSVSMALGMTLNGADGETYTAMQETLELAGLSEEEINTSYQSLIELLTNLDRKVIFEIANSIWYRQGFAVEPPFIDASQTYFDAAIREADFGSPAAVVAINGWVEEQTRGKIDEIIDEIDPDIVMFLINAIYFKGTWTYEFDEDDTRDEAFTQHDGTDVQVPMMRQEADLPYFETEAFQAVDLPYGDSLFSMTILLPREGHDVDDLADALDPAQWNDWVGRFATREVDLRLPRFKLEYEKELNDVLKSLGMEVAFTGLADFTRINRNGGLYIDYVKHKTFVEVNEEGTEAAAVTVVAIAFTSAGGGTAMHVNRPFVFAIRERHSGTILFIGKVNAL